jgi:hypothetical protein
MGPVFCFQTAGLKLFTDVGWVYRQHLQCPAWVIINDLYTETEPTTTTEGWPNNVTWAE